VSPEPADPRQLTGELKAYAAEIGISAAGVTGFDEKFTFAEHRGKAVGEHVVVCVLEQNYDATQRIPAHRSEQAASSTYGELEDRMVLLADWLRERGWRARPEDFQGESMFIAYAVAAGLGQLGLNGQLLTPQAGSRCRINMTIDAPLVGDEPRTLASRESATAARSAYGAARSAPSPMSARNTAASPRPSSTPSAACRR